MSDKQPTPLKAIRLKCLECCCGKPSLVRECDQADCSLHFYRMGNNPNRAGVGRIGNLKTSHSISEKESNHEGPD